MRGRGYECSVSHLFLKMYVCVLPSAYHFFSQSLTIMEAFPNQLHGFLWFPILDRVTVWYGYSKKDNVFVWLIARNTEQSPLCKCL